MELLWYIVLMNMFIVYIILDGYDFGAGIVHLFFGKKEKDKKAIINSIGPFWDANEVWLVAIGGIMYFAFPILYASAFSGFYLPLILILWLLIFRATGLELRGQVNNRLWQVVWDRAFGIASLMLALFFGIALGNVVRGVNLGMVADGVSAQEPHYFFVQLWNPSFSPLAETLGVIDWFTLLIGIIAVVSLTIHGANWIIFKTDSDMNPRLKKAVFNLNILLVLLIVLSIVLLNYIKINPFQSFFKYPGFWIFPIIALVGLFGQFRVKQFKRHGLGFLFSCIFLFGGLATSMVSIFPNVLPSTNAVNPSLTLYNTATDTYGLSVGVFWFTIAIILVAIYMIVQYRVFKGKLDDAGYGEH
ncbi:MAG TPA: cytochrome d ubiquinol oxidase subunit II [Flavobacteriaceae bacterium]|nr:cytochrome d ubiquinol oxidase subunit II [Flavobacteriaceae bacterium]